MTRYLGFFGRILQEHSNETSLLKFLCVAKVSESIKEIFLLCRYLHMNTMVSFEGTVPNLGLETPKVA